MTSAISTASQDGHESPAHPTASKEAQGGSVTLLLDARLPASREDIAGWVYRFDIHIHLHINIHIYIYIYIYMYICIYIYIRDVPYSSDEALLMHFRAVPPQDG